MRKEKRRAEMRRAEMRKGAEECKLVTFSYISFSLEP